MQTETKNKYNSLTFRYSSPQGTCWIQIFELEAGRIDRVILSVGKAGSDIRAMCAAISELVTVMFQNGSSVADVLTHLSGISSDKARKDNGLTIHTPIDALNLALIKYRASVIDEEPDLSRHLRRVR